MMGYILLFVFWAGVLVLRMKDPYDLKRRALVYTGAKIKGVYKGIDMMADRIKTELFRDKVISETAECLGYIKNIAILGRSREISAVALVTQLSEITVRMKTVLEDTARYLSSNDRQSAEKRFRVGTGLDISDGLASLLCGWEDMHPSEISDTVDAYLSLLTEERITAAKKRNEIISDIIFFPVVINCMLVLVNFIYISFFINQQSLIETIV